MKTCLRSPLSASGLHTGLWNKDRRSPTTQLNSTTSTHTFYPPTAAHLEWPASGKPDRQAILKPTKQKYPIHGRLKAWEHESATIAIWKPQEYNTQHTAHNNWACPGRTIASLVIKKRINFKLKHFLSFQGCALSSSGDENSATLS